MRSSVSCWSAPPPGCMGSLRARRQWFSTFLKLWPFNAVPHVMLIPRLKTLSLWLLNCNLATVSRHNVNIYVFWWPYEKVIWPQEVATRRLKTTAIDHGWDSELKNCQYLFPPSLFSSFLPLYSLLSLFLIFFSFLFFSWSGCMYLPISLPQPQGWGE